ncbi:phosphatase PAP2 family protein [Mucilaginibacter flavus]|uniref:phosphatase PAP2 family protein n=1 Tax=Mucilaginibacter flavus TaxID=931504 RepID=UPI0025B39DEF|nr:phosphatase PAP2 family protein [Mucilaginibacter flavus]MDN3582116.1 phosphatase PAP2 family protein [Mucilaginibacter flavus]
MADIKYRKLILILLVVLIAAVLLSSVFYSYDSQIVISLNSYRNPTMDWLFLTITNIAGTITYVVAALALIISFIKRFKAIKLQLRAIALAAALSGLLATVLKHIIHRVRPQDVYLVIRDLGPGGGWSFPSGHSCDAFVLAAILSLVYPKKRLIIPVYCWAITVGFSRMYLGVHYPSDVLGGVLIGSSMALLAYYICTFRRVKA